MPDADRQTVAFYNLENFFDTVDDPVKNDDDFLPGSYKDWSEQRYLEKLENITSSISSIDQNRVPAIIGVAEIENKTVLTDLIYTTRNILYVKGAFDRDDIVHFFVNHWPSRREGTRKTMPKRIAAAQSLSNKTRNILQADPRAKIVIMGDFNDLPVSKSITRYLKDEFYNLAFIPYSKKMGTVFAKGRWLMFDQIMISQGMMIAQGYKIKSSRLTVHFDKRLLFYDKKRAIYRPSRSYSGKKYHGGFSDHLPVYVTMDRAQ